MHMLYGDGLGLTDQSMRRWSFPALQALTHVQKETTADQSGLIQSLTQTSGT